MELPLLFNLAYIASKIGKEWGIAFSRNAVMGKSSTNCLKKIEEKKTIIQYCIDDECYFHGKINIRGVYFCDLKMEFPERKK